MKKPSINPVYLLGDINLDTTFRIETLPVPGGDAVIQSMETGLGGSTANTAIVAARFGLPVYLLGNVGDDDRGIKIQKTLMQSGVETKYVHVCPQSGTGLIFVAISKDGERTMFSFRGANALYSPEQIPIQAVASGSMLHLSGYALLSPPQSDALWKSIDIAEAHNVPISIDLCPPALELQKSSVLRLLPTLSICILGAQEAHEITGYDDPFDGCRALLDAGVEWVVLKMGAKGCILGRNVPTHVVPELVPASAFPIDAVDTTGAGDAFSAGVIFGYLNDLPLEQVGVLSNALGALAASTAGAGISLPGKGPVVQFLISRAANSDHQQAIRRLTELFSEGPNEY
jgi:ribokinase